MLWFQRTAKYSAAQEVLQVLQIFRDINWIQINNYYLYMRWVYNLFVRGFNMSKIVHSLPNYLFLRNSNFGGYITMSLECDDFVFRKVNWPLPLRRGGWVGCRLTAKLPLSVTKPNCRRYLNSFHFSCTKN